MASRTASRLLAAAAVLVLTASCNKATTPPPVEPTTTAPVDPNRHGDTTSAYAGHEDTNEGPSKRQRPEPQTVGDRDAALDAVLRGNPEGAIEFLAGFVGEHADDVEARMALARAQIMVGSLDDAAATLADPAGAPDDLRVVQQRAKLAWRQGKADEATQLLEQASRAHPDDVPLRGELLRVMVQRGRGDEPAAKALVDGLYDAYDDGSAKGPRALVAVAQAALAQGGTGAFHDANMVLQEAEDLAPVSKGEQIADDVLLLRGDMFLDKYAESEAAETFGLLLERDPWHPDALAGMARVHMSGLRFADAARFAEEVLQVDPHHPDAHAVLGRIALIEGRREEARRRSTEESLAVNPSHTGGLAVLAALAIAEGKPDAYASWRDRALVHDRRGRDFFIDLSDILGFLHLYPEADEALREGVKLAPRDPGVQSALGLNLLRLGREKEGREALATAWKRDRFNERTRNVLDLYEETIDRHYEERTEGELTVRLPTEDREFIEHGLLDSVRHSRDELDGHYGMKAGQLRLEFFSDPRAFSVRTVGVPSLGALAVCFGPVITFVGPYSGAYNIDMVVRHELGHTYAIALSGGRVPRWFTEGLSEWESELADPAYARESAALLSQAREAGKLRRLSELELAFIRANSGAMMEVAYATAAYAMRYLGRTYGRPKLIEILRGYREGADTDTLFKQHLGKPISEVEKDFEAWFFDQLDTKISGWEPARSGKGDERDELLKKAIQQASAGDTNEATRTLEGLLTKGGDGFAPRMMLAKMLVDGPNPGAAKRHLEAARGHHTEAIEPLVMLANLARTEGMVDDEKTHLQAAMKIDGDSIEPAARLLMLGIVTHDDAARDLGLARIRGIAPLHPIALSAQALKMSKDKSERARAGKFLRRALRDLQPGQGPADTFVVVALAADALDQTNDAKTMAQAALADKALPKAARDRLGTIGNK
ncbi:MAG: tetratricopeptide repeat protein [Myxococcota bacterium]